MAVKFLHHSHENKLQYFSKYIVFRRMGVTTSPFHLKHMHSGCVSPDHHLLGKEKTLYRLFKILVPNFTENDFSPIEAPISTGEAISPNQSCMHICNVLFLQGNNFQFESLLLRGWEWGSRRKMDASVDHPYTIFSWLAPGPTARCTSQNTKYTRRRWWHPLNRPVLFQIAFGIGNWKGALQASNADQEKKRQQTGSLRMAYKNHTLAEPFSLAAGGGQCIPSEVWTSPNRRWWDGDIWRQGRVAKPACIYLFGLLLPIVIAVVVIWGSGVGKGRERKRLRERERVRERLKQSSFRATKKQRKFHRVEGREAACCYFHKWPKRFSGAGFNCLGSPFHSIKHRAISSTINPESMGTTLLNAKKKKRF